MNPLVPLIEQFDLHLEPKRATGYAFGPANIAVVKYWGKRDASGLNLPVTDSLSVTLDSLGATTRVSAVAGHDVFELNGEVLPEDIQFCQRLKVYLDPLRSETVPYFHIDTVSDIPVSAGLASSASGYAALVGALDDFFQWNLSAQSLSVLARLGSGSACRSFWSGFVRWQSGVREDGLDSHGVPLCDDWPGLCMGVLMVSDQPKLIDSGRAMQLSVETSPLYKRWSEQVYSDMRAILPTIAERDFEAFGNIIEQNALAMHAVMAQSIPAINYTTEATRFAMAKVIEARKDGLCVYFTQDAGPNLKLFFLEDEREEIQQRFNFAHVVELF